jgi:hypothetical protein
MNSKFSFIFKTDHGNGRITELVLAETESRDRASMLRHKIASVSGGLTQMRICKKVTVIGVQPHRFKMFNLSVSAPPKGTIFNSLDALAAAIGANVATLRASLSRSYKAKKTQATVRGITYAYAK